MLTNANECCKCKGDKEVLEILQSLVPLHTANVLIVLSTSFGSVTFPIVIWQRMIHAKIVIELKLYSSMSLSTMGTAVGCDNYFKITVGNVTLPMTVNWL